MANKRKHGTALSLFLIAGFLYAIGWAGSALFFSVIGIFFELAAWASLFIEGKEKSTEEEQ